MTPLAIEGWVVALTVAGGGPVALWGVVAGRIDAVALALGVALGVLLPEALPLPPFGP